MKNILIGNIAEEHALEFLTNQGLRLLERNFQTKLGEIDLIMEKNEQIIFIEVRYRSYLSHGGAAASIVNDKQNRIIRTATIYLQKQKLLYKRYYRFDVVAIDLIGGKPQVEWIKNAFSGQW